MAAGIATRPGRPLPGQDFHLLEQRTFTAHLDQHTGRDGPLPGQDIQLFGTTDLSRYTWTNTVESENPSVRSPSLASSSQSPLKRGNHVDGRLEITVRIPEHIMLEITMMRDKPR